MVKQALAKDNMGQDLLDKGKLSFNILDGCTLPQNIILYPNCQITTYEDAILTLNSVEQASTRNNMRKGSPDQG